MLDLIRTAYGVEPEKVVGGPNWLASDRFDVIAKVPAGVSRENIQLMLRALLARTIFDAVEKQLGLKLETKQIRDAGHRRGQRESETDRQSAGRCRSFAAREAGIRNSIVIDRMEQKPID